MRQTERPIRTCERCGHQGPDVSSQIGYVGLRMVVQLLCDDQDGCWTQWAAWARKYEEVSHCRVVSTAAANPMTSSSTSTTTATATP